MGHDPGLLDKSNVNMSTVTSNRVGQPTKPQSRIHDTTVASGAEVNIRHWPVGGGRLTPQLLSA